MSTPGLVFSGLVFSGTLNRKVYTRFTHHQERG
jgi:hypothetical protein